MRVILLSGPPNCGKDTIANIIMYSHPSHRHHKFSHKLKQQVHAIFGIKQSCEELELAFGKQWKDTPNKAMNGMTPRQAYIWFSEEVIKPKFGKDYYGKQALTRLKECNGGLVVFSDCGFEEEVHPVLDYMGSLVSGSQINCALVHVCREGCDFSNDSRTYVGRNRRYKNTSLHLLNNAGLLSDLHNTLTIKTINALFQNNHN